MAEPAAPEQAADDLAARHSCHVIDSHLSTALERSALQICMQAVERHRSTKDIAAFVKTEFDKQHLEPQAEGAYHCIVGKHFASAISHDVQQYILLNVDTLNIVLFRSRDVANAVLEP